VKLSEEFSQRSGQVDYKFGRDLPHKRELNLDISDKDFCIHVLNNLPSKYEIQVPKLEDQLGSATN